MIFRGFKGGMQKANIGGIAQKGSLDSLQI